MSTVEHAPAARTLTVVHDSPGRLRLRLPRGVAGASVRDTAQGVDGVLHAAWSPRTRSLLILYRPDVVSAEQLTASIARDAALRPPRPAASLLSATVGSRTRFGAAVAKAFGDLDHAIREESRGFISLGGLLPVALAAWAGAELLRGRTAPLAWSSALWYAHGLFRDYHPPSSER